MLKIIGRSQKAIMQHKNEAVARVHRPSALYIAKQNNSYQLSFNIYFITFITIYN